jgi:hypothetical protein
MPQFTEKQVEAEARRILRAKIKAMPWHADLPPEERKRLIEVDVERWWHLEVKEAAKRLLDRLRDAKQKGPGNAEALQR